MVATAARARRAGVNSTLFGALADLRADWNIAKESPYRSRVSGVQPNGSHADYHFRSPADFYKSIETARSYRRNNMVVGAGVQRLVDNVLMEGFTPDPQSGDEGFDDEMLARWSDWSVDPDQVDIQGECDFHQIERMTLDQVVTDGDLLHVGLNTGHLQTFEAHRIRTPSNTKRNVVLGVLLSDVRRRLEYWVSKEDVGVFGSVKAVGDMLQYAARDEDGHRNAFFVYFPFRRSQTRGVTALAPIVDPAAMHDDIQFATMVQRQIVSCVGMLIEQAHDPLGRSQSVGGFATGEQQQVQRADGSIENLEGLSPGFKAFLKPGQKVVAFNPSVPNPEFFTHTNLILTFIAINLGLPLACLLLDPSNTNFSGWRGAMDEARKGFRRVQRVLVSRLHTPIWRFKIKQWLAEDTAAAKIAAKYEGRPETFDPYCHRWNPPTWPYIEPVNDAAGDLLRRRSLFVSPRRLAAERGREWSQIVRESVEDYAKTYRVARDMARVLNGESQDEHEKLTWRDLLDLPTADSVKLTLAPPAVGEAPAPAPAPKKHESAA